MPLYPLTPEDQSRVLTELTLEGTSENSVIELDVTGCPFLTQFSMEIFRPAIAGTRIFYGAREVLTIPATEVESYVDPDTGYEVRMRQQLPVRLERFFHESTAVQDVKMKK